jgi:antitoxin CptB
MDSAEIEKRRVRMLCRRGMLELDILLRNFFEAQYDHLPIQERDILVALLKEEDPVLWAWFMDDFPAPSQDLQIMVKRILDWQQQA